MLEDRDGGEGEIVENGDHPDPLFVFGMSFARNTVTT